MHLEPNTDGHTRLLYYDVGLSQLIAEGGWM